jgi:hypothetical protein
VAAGYFNISQDGDSLDIAYQVADKNAGDCPDDQLALKNDIEAAEATLKVLYPDPEARMPRFRELLSLAQVGLQGNAQPKVAASALANLKRSILMIEGGLRKNRYFKKLGIIAALYALPAFGLAMALKCWLPKFLIMLAGCDLRQLMPLTVALSLLFGGAMIGAWLSYGLRTVALTFEDLATPEEDRLEPYVRLAFVGALTLVVGLALYLGVFEISLGKVSSQDLVHRNALALLIGVLLGASERALTEQVSKLVGNLLPK